MSRYFLVDYERIRENPSNGLDGIEQLTADDTVWILLADETESISFQAMKKIMASPVKFDQKLLPKSGELAIECALSFLIGEISGQSTFKFRNVDISAEIFVISSDRYCFEFLKKFMSKKLILCSSLGEAINQPKIPDNIMDALNQMGEDTSAFKSKENRKQFQKSLHKKGL